MKLKFVSKNKPTKLWAPFKAWWIGGSQLETLPQSSHTIHGCRVCLNKIQKTLLPYLSYCTLPECIISLPLPTAVSYNTPQIPKVILHNFICWYINLIQNPRHLCVCNRTLNVFWSTGHLGNTSRFKGIFLKSTPDATCMKYSSVFG